MLKNPPVNAGYARDVDLIFELGRASGGGNGNPVQHFCLENPMGKRNLAGYSLWGRKEFGMTEHSTQSIIYHFSSVAQSCPTLCDPMNLSTPGLPVHHHLPEFTQTHVHRESVMPSSHLILCRPLLLLPPIPPSIKLFSNESTLCLTWPKY